MRIPAMLQRIAAVTVSPCMPGTSSGRTSSNPKATARELHAGITAQLTQRYNEPSVMVAFLFVPDVIF
jgi:hypothetical protein